jgi:hypothetical protein
MALARYQFTCHDGFGNLLPHATVEVRTETSGQPLAALWSDREGLTAMPNPFQADGNGLAVFHTAGGAYQIRVTSGDLVAVRRYVAIGTAQEADAAAFTVVPATDTAAGIVELATAEEVQTGSDTTRAVTPAGLHAAALKQGKHTVWVPASAMVPRATNGAAAVTSELGTNRVMLRTLDFDPTTQEFAQFTIAMPKAWNEGTVTFQPYWTAGSGSGGVVWQLAGLARSDDDPLGAAFGTAQNSTDTFIAANDLHIGPESAAITIGGSPAENDLVVFEVRRVPGDAGDTLAVDAKLLGVKIFITLNAPTDS